MQISQKSQENTCPAIFFNKAAGWKLKERDPGTRVLLWILQSFKNTYFEEHLQAPASLFQYFQHCNTLKQS